MSNAHPLKLSAQQGRTPKPSQSHYVKSFALGTHCELQPSFTQFVVELLLNINDIIVSRYGHLLVQTEWDRGPTQIGHLDGNVLGPPLSHPVTDKVAPKHARMVGDATS